MGLQKDVMQSFPGEVILTRQPHTSQPGSYGLIGSRSQACWSRGNLTRQEYIDRSDGLRNRTNEASIFIVTMPGYLPVGGRKISGYREETAL